MYTGFRIAQRIPRMALVLGALCAPAFGQAPGQAASAPTAPEAQAAIIPLQGLEPGTAFSADIDYRNVSGSDLTPLLGDVKASTGDAQAPAAQAGMNRSIEIRISGRMELSVIGRDGGSQLLRLWMPKAKTVLLSDGANARLEAGNIARCLASGPVFAVTAQGNVTALWMKPVCGATPANSVRTLAALLQFMVPQAGATGLASWETQEDDQTGKYAVHYSRQAQTQDAVTFRKEKTQFLPPQSKKRSRHVILPVAYQPHGAMDFGFDASGQLLSITGEESYEIVINGRNVGSSNTAFSLKRTGLATLAAGTQQALLAAHAALARTSKSTPLWLPQTSAETDNLLYRQKLGHDTVDSLLAELSAAAKAGVRNEESTELYQKLKALIYLHPESCPRLARAAAMGKADGLASRLLIRALATIGSPAAQDAILSVLRARARDTDFVMALIPVLGAFEQPTRATEAALERLAYRSRDEDIVFTAQLALGALAGNVAEDDPLRAQHIVDTFMARYPAPTEARDMSRVILVLGNTRMDQYLPVLQTYAADPLPEARSDAVYALRFFSGESVENTLFHALAQDEDATTRREAATSLGRMEASDRVVAALTRAYANEKIDEIRVEILNSLGRFMQQYPEIRKLLEQAAEKDASEEVRKAARSVLSRSQG